jgi:hypothetical protein
MSTAMAFDVLTPLGFRVRCTGEWREYVSKVKHPVLEGRLDDVVATLTAPTEVRRSTKDPSVLLFHRPVAPRLLCAVTQTGKRDAFLVTAYPTDTVKRGDSLWTASK